MLTGPLDRWRWRESNPRPRQTVAGLYERSRHLLLARRVAADLATSGPADGSWRILSASDALHVGALAPITGRPTSCRWGGTAPRGSFLGLPVCRAYAATATGVAQVLAIGLALVVCSWGYGDGASPARSLQPICPVETFHPRLQYSVRKIFVNFIADLWTRRPPVSGQAGDVRPGRPGRRSAFFPAGCPLTFRPYNGDDGEAEKGQRRPC